VKLLVDANLSPRVAAALRDSGHDAAHVADVGLAHASDEDILAAAERDGRIVISGDADFGMLLTIRRAAGPSFVLIRSADHLTADEQAQLLVDVLATAEAELVGGAIVSVSRRHVRVRTLPVGSDGGEE
jgi:predicted nuclease of predicted toxin-antitoxin system